MKKHFNFVSQSFTLNLPTILILLLVCFFVFSFYITPLPTSPLSSLLIQLTQTPQLTKLHLDLARLYLNLGNRNEAAKEMMLAKSAMEKTNVLGSTSEIEDEIKLGPERIRVTQAYWENILRENPSYRDGWVALYYNALNAGKKNDASSYLRKVAKLDPNFADKLIK